MTPARELSDADALIAELRAGRMVVLVDDEDRENEGDLVMAAACVSADAINFMAKHGRGLICLTLTEARCRQLNLPLMVNENRSSHGTAFTVSIEAASGVTTGISAADRATTIAAAVAADARPQDLVQPGHIFPLMAQSGGVLARAGHTEAGCDLAALAGFEPAAVICEILKDDGEMARLPDLVAYAKTHGLKIAAPTRVWSRGYPSARFRLPMGHFVWWSIVTARPVSPIWPSCWARPRMIVNVWFGSMSRSR
jgi:3,4-dihydroxy 2-butanone 4-phosphate synthase/GTP cyclohydrolase II